MNKKKITKILSATLSIVYITNSTPVFAQDIEINTEIIKDEVNKIEVIDEDENFFENEEVDKETDKILDTDKIDANKDDVVGFDDNDIIYTEGTLTDEKLDVDEETDKIEEVVEDSDVEEEKLNVFLENVEETNIECENEDIEVLADVIDFKDENLLKAINKSLRRSENTPITLAELEVITSLNLSSSNISDLSGLEYATALTVLNISDNNISNLKSISKLTSLNVLDISNNKGTITVDEFKSISGLSNLEQIKIPIMDKSNDLIIDASYEFKKIKILDLSGSYTGNINISYIGDFENLIINNSVVKDIVLNNITCNKKDKYAFCISVRKTNANKFYMYNSNIKSSVELDESTINSVIFEDNYIYNHINLQKGNYGDILMNNIYETGYMNFTDSSMSNIDLKNMPNLTSLYIGNLKAPEFNLSNLELVDIIYATGAQIDKVWIHDMPVLDYLYLNESKCETIYLDDLPKLKYINCTKLKNCNEIKINNSSKVDYFYVDDAQVDLINIIDSCSKDSIYATFQRSDIDTIYAQNSYMGSVFCDYSTIDNIIFENCPRCLSGSYFSVSSSVVNKVVLENTSYKRLELRKSLINYFNMDDGQLITYIDLSNSSFNDFSIIKASNVSYIDTLETKVKNMTLGGFNEIDSLDLSNAGLENINLTGFEKLQTVNLDNNNLENIDCLGNISSLETITASNNNINSIEQLKNLTTLKNVNLDNNKIKDISYLSNNVDLQTTNLSVLNQNIELEDVYSKGGIVSISYPNIIDIDGSKTPVIAVSNNGAIGKDFIAWKYDDSDGILTEQIETSSINNNFTVAANQKIVIDNVAPILNVSVDTTEFTNKDITATVVASDELSGLDSISLPDGSVIKRDKVKTSEYNDITFNITKNGEYTFIAKDKVGNTTEKTITINNIDKEKPVIEIDKIKDLSNKKQFIISINAKDNVSGIKSITLPDGTVISKNNITYTFTQNGSYIVLVEDYAGNIAIESIDVKNLSVDDDKVTDSVNNNNNNEGNNSVNTNTNIPNTGGLAGVISMTSILSVIGGWFCINKKKQK